VWKEAIQTELNSLAKREVFGSIVHTPKCVMPVGYKLVFLTKWNEYNEIVIYKAWLVVQGFSQRLYIDYEKTYSLVMNVITFRFLIGLVVLETLDMLLIDVVTTYLHGSLDKDIHIKIPERFKMSEAFYDKPIIVSFIKV